MSERAQVYDPRLYIEIGRRIREARRRANVSQEQLAKEVKLKRTSVTNIEKGKQRCVPHKLYEIADYLDISPQTLFPSPAELLVPAEKMLDRVDASARPFTESIFKKAKVSS